MAQISLTFPDGNKRVYDAGVTAAEVAQSIAPSLGQGGDFGAGEWRALGSAMADHGGCHHLASTR